MPDKPKDKGKGKAKAGIDHEYKKVSFSERLRKSLSRVFSGSSAQPSPSDSAGPSTRPIHLHPLTRAVSRSDLLAPPTLPIRAQSAYITTDPTDIFGDRLRNRKPGTRSEVYLPIPTFPTRSSSHPSSSVDDFGRTNRSLLSIHSAPGSRRPSTAPSVDPRESESLPIRDNRSKPRVVKKEKLEYLVQRRPSFDLIIGEVVPRDIWVSFGDRRLQDQLFRGVVRLEDIPSRSRERGLRLRPRPSTSAVPLTGTAPSISIPDDRPVNPQVQTLPPLIQPLNLDLRRLSLNFGAPPSPVLPQQPNSEPSALPTTIQAPSPLDLGSANVVDSFQTPPHLNPGSTSVHFVEPAENYTSIFESGSDIDSIGPSLPSGASSPASVAGLVPRPYRLGSTPYHHPRHTNDDSDGQSESSSYFPPQPIPTVQTPVEVEEVTITGNLADEILDQLVWASTGGDEQEEPVIASPSYTFPPRPQGVPPSYELAPLGAPVPQSGLRRVHRPLPPRYPPPDIPLPPIPTTGTSSAPNRVLTVGDAQHAWRVRENNIAGPSTLNARDLAAEESDESSIHLITDDGNGDDPFDFYESDPLDMRARRAAHRRRRGDDAYMEEEDGESDIIRSRRAGQDLMEEMMERRQMEINTERDALAQYQLRRQGLQRGTIQPTSPRQLTQSAPTIFSPRLFPSANAGEDLDALGNILGLSMGVGRRRSAPGLMDWDTDLRRRRMGSPLFDFRAHAGIPGSEAIEAAAGNGDSPIIGRRLDYGVSITTSTSTAITNSSSDSPIIPVISSSHDTPNPGQGVTSSLPDITPIQTTGTMIGNSHTLASGSTSGGFTEELLSPHGDVQSVGVALGQVLERDQNRGGEGSGGEGRRGLIIPGAFIVRGEGGEVASELVTGDDKAEVEVRADEDARREELAMRRV